MMLKTFLETAKKYMFDHNSSEYDQDELKYLNNSIDYKDLKSRFKSLENRTRMNHFP